MNFSILIAKRGSFLKNDQVSGREICGTKWKQGFQPKSQGGRFLVLDLRPSTSVDKIQDMEETTFYVVHFAIL